MAQTLILLLLGLSVAPAQEPEPKAGQKSPRSQPTPQQTANDLFVFASSGDKAALQKLTAMAQAGDALAQYWLGVAYAQGEGVPRNAAQGVAWYRKAAAQGLVQAQDSLGWHYALGEGVRKSEAQAVEWERKAAEQGYANAQYNLGLMYAQGQGVLKDAVQAVEWYRKAAEQGSPHAQYKLGLAYVEGKGVRTDYVAAYMWFNLAAAQGNNHAKEGRDMVEAIITPAEVAEAQRLSRERKAAQQGNPQTQNALDAMKAKKVVPMLQEGGVYKVPVLINNNITLNFVVDSGAADVSIPADVVTTLMRAGTITQSDFIGARTYALADGSTTSSPTFRIRSLKVGDIVLNDVLGSVANMQGYLLLGQSFLGRFKSWSIDNTNHRLVLE